MSRLGMDLVALRQAGSRRVAGRHDCLRPHMSTLQQAWGPDGFCLEQGRKSPPSYWATSHTTGLVRVPQLDYLWHTMATDAVTDDLSHN